MLPRSKPLLAFLLALPLSLVVVMWSLSQRRPRLVTTLRTPASSLVLSKDSSILGIGAHDGSLSLWSRETNKRQTLPVDVATAFSSVIPPELSLSSDERTLFASNLQSINGSTLLYAWNVPTPQIRWSLVFDAKDDIRQFPPSPDGKVAISRTLDVVKVFDTSSGGTPRNTKLSKFAHTFPGVTVFKETGAVKSASKWPRTITVSPDGKTLALAYPDAHVDFWDIATGQKQSQTPPTRISPYTDWKLRYSPDGRFVALFVGSQIGLWDVTAATWTMATVAVPTSAPSLVWMPDSHSLWTGGGSAQQWSVPKVGSLREVPVSGPIAVSGDGKTLATRSLTSNGVNGVWLWNIG